jgi:hypothetical protein
MKRRAGVHIPAVMAEPFCPPDLADFECVHGRLATDPTPACGCWPNDRGAKAA